MKIGVSSYSFASYRRRTGAGFIEICDMAKEIGFDAIEFIGLHREEDCTYQWKLETAEKIRRHCERIGLDIPAYTVGADLINGDADEAVEELFRCLEITKRLGASVMRHDITFKLPEGWTYKDAIGVAVPRIRRVADKAAELGITTCLENHGVIFQAPERVEELILAVDRENFGWLCDIGNFLCADCEPAASCKVAAKYTVHAHAKDFLFRRASETACAGFRIETTGGNRLRGTVVGHGIVPVGECIRILKDGGYDGYVSLEFEGPEESEYALKNGYANLKAVVEAAE